MCAAAKKMNHLIQRWGLHIGPMRGHKMPDLRLWGQEELMWLTIESEVGIVGSESWDELTKRKKFEVLKYLRS